MQISRGEKVIMGIFDFFSKKQTRLEKVTSTSSSQLRINSLLKMVDESTHIIQNTNNLDIVLGRYETVRMHLIERPKNDDLIIENLDETMEGLRDIASDGISNCCIGAFNEKVKKAMEMKTTKGQANNLIKVIKYYEDNLDKIPGELIEYCESDIESCKQAISDIKDKNNKWTTLIKEAGINIPDWWKRDWKEELTEKRNPGRAEGGQIER
tara:strand:- start:520 stop:1152 length:633 start_codon:yes stop_codon:yes gene_type:complete